MRFPVVLFDLDGALIDSGKMILASMQHATRTVLGREIPEAELMAAVGGPGIERFFEVVVGGDGTGRRKPDPQPLLVALDRLGARADDSAYVGDAPFDVLAAKAAGLFSVAVTWGGIHTRGRLEAEAPDAIVDSAGELLAVL